jgi:hypothetical protein
MDSKACHALLSHCEKRFNQCTINGDEVRGVRLNAGYARTSPVAPASRGQKKIGVRAVLVAAAALGTPRLPPKRIS